MAWMTEDPEVRDHYIKRARKALERAYDGPIRKLDPIIKGSPVDEIYMGTWLQNYAAAYDWVQPYLDTIGGAGAAFLAPPPAPLKGWVLNQVLLIDAVYLLADHPAEMRQVMDRAHARNLDWYGGAADGEERDRGQQQGQALHAGVLDKQRFQYLQAITHR